MFERILVPIDTSPGADRALGCAIDLAVDQQAALRVIHVVETPAGSLFDVNGVNLVASERAGRNESKPILDNADARARDANVSAECVILPSEGCKASDVILHDAEQWAADLLVVGTGRRGVGRIVFGSVADELIHESEIPVMVV